MCLKKGGILSCLLTLYRVYIFNKTSSVFCRHTSGVCCMCWIKTSKNHFCLISPEKYSVYMQVYWAKFVFSCIMLLPQVYHGGCDWIKKKNLVVYPKDATFKAQWAQTSNTPQSLLLLWLSTSFSKQPKAFCLLNGHKLPTMMKELYGVLHFTF